MNNDNKKEILNGIQNQIASFDNKASILLSVVGIVFALAISFLEIFHADFFIELNCETAFWFYFIFCLLILSTVGSLTLLILAIVPRKHSGDKKYPNYYVDINDLSTDELKTLIKEYEEKDDLILEQIKINSGICCRKHTFLKFAIISLAPFIASIIAMVLMIIFTK